MRTEVEFDRTDLFVHDHAAPALEAPASIDQLRARCVFRRPHIAVVAEASPTAPCADSGNPHRLAERDHFEIVTPGSKADAPF